MCIIINMYLTHFINQSFFSVTVLLKCLEIVYCTFEMGEKC